MDRIKTFQFYRRGLKKSIRKTLIFKGENPDFWVSDWWNEWLAVEINLNYDNDSRI